MIVPSTHSKADIKDRPLPRAGGQVVLFVRVRDKGIVGGHHCDVQMDEILPERRLESPRIPGRYCTVKLVLVDRPTPSSALTSIVYMAFHVPVCIFVPWLILFHTGRLNLLETPLRQIDIASAKVTAKVNMFQPESSG